MTVSVPSLPPRPLTKAEILEAEDNAREYCIDLLEEVAYIFTYIGEENVYALGFDDNDEEWVVISDSDIEYSDEAVKEFEEKIYTWAETHYGDELEEGTLVMSGPVDPSIHERYEPDWD